MKVYFALSFFVVCAHGLETTGSTVPPGFQRQSGKKASGCPSSSPHALDHGQKCCSMAIRSTTCTVGSAGTRLEFEDPVTCCRDAEPQNCGDNACVDNTAVADKLCQWSEWFDRDNPGSTGDHEDDLWRFDSSDGACTLPLKLEARRISDQAAAETTGQVFLKYDLSGFVCLNADQPVGNCDGYEMRMCCE